MSKRMNPLLAWAKRFSILGIGLCGLCCLAPLIIGITGISSLSLFFKISETVGIIGLIVSLILIIFWYYRKRQHACSIDCSCKLENANTNFDR